MPEQKPIYLAKRMKHIANQLAEITDALNANNDVFAAAALDQVVADLDFVRAAYFAKTQGRPAPSEL